MRKKSGITSSQATTVAAFHTANGIFVRRAVSIRSSLQKKRREEKNIRHDDLWLHLFTEINYISVVMQKYVGWFNSSLYNKLILGLVWENK